MSKKALSDNGRVKRDYLKAQINALEAESGVKEEIKTTLKDSCLSIKREIMLEAKTVNPNAKNVSEVIEHMGMKDSKNVNGIEENIRLQKLKDNERRKKELEDKLKYLNDNITYLRDENGPKTSPGLTKAKAGRNTVIPEGSVEAKTDNTIQSAEFVKKLNQEKREFKQKMREKKKEEQGKLEEDMKRMEKEKKKAEKEREKNLELKNEERRVKDEMRKQDLGDRMSKIKEETRRLVSKEPQFKKIEEKFISDVVASELEKRKKELAEIRSLHKPIGREDIDEHARKHDEILQMKLAERGKERREKYAEAHSSYDFHKYKSKFTEDVLDNEEKRKEEERRKEEEKRKNAEKMQSYAKFVKEMHVPQVSRKKQLELQLMIENQKHHPFRKFDKAKSRASDGDGDSADERMNGALSDGEGGEARRLTKPKFKPNKMIPKPKSPRSSKDVDWLKEMRVKRQDNEKDGNGKRPDNEDWNKVLNDEKLTPQERYELIKQKAKKIEENAQRKEQLLKANSNQIEPEQASQVNDMLIEAIKAKLAILDAV